MGCLLGPVVIRGKHCPVEDSPERARGVRAKATEAVPRMGAGVPGPATKGFLGLWV